MNTEASSLPGKPDALKTEIAATETGDNGGSPLVSFYQLLRSIQSLSGRRVGYDLHPGDEPVHLHCDLAASFPVNELARWLPQSQTLEVSFFGLFGPSGALPQHYTQKMLERVREGDHTLRDFLDMFNHRLLSFFYRAWEKHQLAVAFETAVAAGTEDNVTKALWALIGMRNGESGQVGRNRLHIPDTNFLYYSGQLANRRPTAEGLRVTLQHAFNLKTQILQFVGQWMFLSVDDQSRLSSSALGYSLGNQLGMDTIVGSRVWDNQNKFRVRIGPIPWRKFQDLTPLKPQLRRIADFVRQSVGPQYDFDIQVTIARETIPCAILGDQQSSYLGWNTWIGDWNKPYDADDSVYQISDFESI